MSKILLIEDDPLLINVYKTYLENRGHKVLAVEEGTQAVSSVKKFKPDAVVLDLMVPKIGGSSILKKIKKLEETQKIPVIVYTNLDSPEKEKEMMQHGASAFISKSRSNPKEVTRKIEELLAQK